jgi:membrane fusion protein (multidrug efflux system)
MKNLHTSGFQLRVGHAGSVVRQSDGLPVTSPPGLLGSGLYVICSASEFSSTQFRSLESQMATSNWFRFATRLGAAGLAIVLGACSDGEQAPPPPPNVVVTEAARQDVPIYGEFVAKIDARETVEIRARVQAFLEAQHFTEGTIVRKDQLLFTLDRREYETKLQQANAELEVAMARLGKAETDERRLKPLAERRAVPQQDYDDAMANLLSARTGVAAARANVDAAKLDLGYTTIRSPIAGLIGKRLVAPGNLVGKDEPTLLDTVSSIDPIRVNATISEAEYLRFFAQHKDGSSNSGPLDLILVDGRVFPYQGKLVIVDRAVDETTGTLNFVAEFPNPEGLLRPGQFGRVRAVVETVRDAVVVPKRAVQEIQGMQALFVVGADNKVELRTIQPGETAGDLLIVREGLKPGERVIVDGTQKARPGSMVNPTTAGTPPPATSAGDKTQEDKPAGPDAAKAGEK